MTTAITLAELTAEGRAVNASCNRCGHRSALSAAALGERFGGDAVLDVVRRRLKCQRCGSTDVLAVPQSSRSVRQGRER